MKTKLEKSLLLTSIPWAFFSALQQLVQEQEKETAVARGREGDREKERKRKRETVRQSRASNLARVQRINNSGRNVKQRRLRMIFAEVVVVTPLATLPHDPLVCQRSFLLCLLAAWISNTIVWALFPFLPCFSAVCLLGRSSLLKSCWRWCSLRVKKGEQHL